MRVMLGGLSVLVSAVSWGSVRFSSPGGFPGQTGITIGASTGGRKPIKNGKRMKFMSYPELGMKKNLRWGLPVRAILEVFDGEFAAKSPRKALGNSCTP
jgi:hypothetical protein